jgi:hypothetical protein
VQVPTATPVTVLPEVVQTVSVVDVKATESPELAVALTVPVAGRVIELGALKVIVWLRSAYSCTCPALA